MGVKTAPESEDPYGEPFKFDPNFKGPIRKRSCTDVLCLILFILFLALWSFVGLVAFVKGDVKKVLYPTDSWGRLCGQGQMENRTYLMYFDLTRCLNPAILTLGCPTPQVCVQKCPVEASSGFGLQFQGQETEAKEAMRPFCFPMSEDEFEIKTAKELINQGLCPAWTLPSTPIIGRCLPMIPASSSDDYKSNNDLLKQEATATNETITQDKLKKAMTALGAFLSVRDFGERIFNDISDTWWMIGAGYIIACGLSFFWIFLMRFIAGLMVWTSIGLLYTLTAGLFGYSLHRYYLVKDIADAQISILEVNFTPDYLKDVLSLRDTWLAFVIILGIILVFITLVLIALRQRILIAIELIEQAAKAVNQMCTTVFLPIVPFLLQFGILIWFALVAMCLSSIGRQVYTVQYDHSSIGSEYSRSLIESTTPEPPSSCVADGNCLNPETNRPYAFLDECDPGIFNNTCNDCLEMRCQFTKYERGTSMLDNWMVWLNLFGFFWGIEFATGLGEIILAGVFAKWYWTLDKRQVPFTSIGTSFCNVFCFHLGTVAFGSLIIAIIKMIRTVLQYVESKLKMYNNDLTKMLLCLCKCFLWCLEKFVRFINRNAYIMCAIKSTNFCSSAKSAFSLLMRNILRVVVLNNIVSFLLFLGRIVVVISVGVLSYFTFSRQIPELSDEIPTLNFMFTPIVVIVIGTYFIAKSFFRVYAMAVDTLFLCFLEDLERNDGTPSRPYFMSKGLQKIVGKMQKFEVTSDMTLVKPKL